MGKEWLLLSSRFRPSGFRPSGFRPSGFKLDCLCGRQPLRLRGAAALQNDVAKLCPGRRRHGWLIGCETRNETDQDQRNSKHK